MSRKKTVLKKQKLDMGTKFILTPEGKAGKPKSSKVLHGLKSMTPKASRSSTKTGARKSKPSLTSWLTSAIMPMSLKKGNHMTKIKQTLHKLTQAVAHTILALFAAYGMRMLLQNAGDLASMFVTAVTIVALVVIAHD